MIFASGTVSEKPNPNDYTRSLKVNTAVELLVQETFQLCSAIHSSVTLLCSAAASLARPKSYGRPATHTSALYRL